MFHLSERNAKLLSKTEKYQVCVLVFSAVFLLNGSSVHASTVTYIPANLSLDATSTLQGGSDLRISSSTLYLNWNQPVTDSYTVGYWPLNAATGTTATDVSSHANNGTLFNQNSGYFMSDWATTTPNVYSGAGAMNFTNTGEVLVGNGSVLRYEYTQPWTVSAAIKIPAKPSNPAVIFSNVSPSAPYYGYELWIDSNGFLRVRIMSGWYGSATGTASALLGKEGTTNVADNAWHFVIATYDGSGTAAGINIYLDGVLQTMTTESEGGLTGSIVNSNQVFTVGNQNNWETQYYMHGYLDEFSLSNVARTSGYISSHSASSSLPTIDATTVLYFHFDDGVGPFVHDSSSNHYDGTITFPQEWLGDYSYYESPTASPYPYIQVPAISNYNLGSNFTISAWGDSSCAANTNQTIVDKSNPSSPYDGWLYSQYSSYIQWDTGAPNFVSSGAGVNSGWHNYAINFNSGTLNFYTDGQIVQTLTGVASPTNNTNNSIPLLIGYYGGTGGWCGNLNAVTISSTTRSTPYIQEFARRFPSSGIASLANVSSSTSTGGGNFGSNVTISELDASFDNASSTKIMYRIGMGSTPAAATANKVAQSFSTLNATNTVNLSGQYVDYDIKLLSSTDSLGSLTPAVQSVALDYSLSTIPPTLATSSPTNLASTSVTLNASIAADGGASSTVEGFNYGTTTSYGSVASTTGTFGVGSFSQSITGLTCNTLYHFQAFAVNTAGTGTSTDATFTTSPCNYTLTYSAGANGTLSGSTTQVVAVGGSGSAVIATANSGYHFVNWSDGSTTDPRTDANVAGNVTVTANFATTTYTFTGPSSGNVGSASTNFTVTPNWPFTGNIVITPTGPGSTGLSSTTLTFSNSSSSQTFTVTPTVAGSITLTPSNTGGLTDALPLTYTANAVAPGSPTSVSAATSTPNQATVTFTPGSNGGSSILYYLASSTPGGFTATSTGSPIIVAGLANGTSYTFSVYAVNTVGTSSPSTASNSVVPVGLPGAPTSVSATAGNTQAVINFSAPASNGGTPISGYTVTSSPAGGTDTNAGTTALTHTVTGLTNGQSYTFTVTATNAIGTGSSSTASNSVTPSTVAAVSTNTVTNIASTSATLSGSITSTGGANATQSGFAYGTTTNLSSGAATTTLGSQTGTVTFTQGITGLSPNTSYYVRAYAVNVSGTTTGSVVSFLTLPAVPSLTTQAPTSGSGIFFTANGTITATGGVNATVRGFVYGTSTAYGATTTETGSFGTGAFTAKISSISCNTLYHVNSYAVNTGGMGYGSDQTITTGTCTSPILTANAASALTTTGATLNGTMTADGNASSTIEGFNWGTDTTYGHQASASGTFGTGSFSQSLTGVVCGTLYHFQAFATNVVGTGTSTDLTFNTSACTQTSNSPAISAGGGGGYVSAVALANLLTPSASTTAYINSLTAKTISNCPVGWKCLPVTSSSTPTPATPLFTINLAIGSTGPGVKALQVYLNSHGFTVAVSGSGSLSHETTNFGILTQRALIKFQKAQGIPATGYFGPTTRGVVNEM